MLVWWKPCFAKQTWPPQGFAVGDQELRWRVSWTLEANNE